VQHFHWTRNLEAHFIATAKLNVRSGIQNALLRCVLQALFVLLPDQSGNLIQRFGLAIGQMVVTFEAGWSHSWQSCATCLF